MAHISWETIGCDAMKGVRALRGIDDAVLTWLVSTDDGVNALHNALREMVTKVIGAYDSRRSEIASQSTQLGHGTSPLQTHEYMLGIGACVADELREQACLRGVDFISFAEWALTEGGVAIIAAGAETMLDMYDARESI